MALGGYDGDRCSAAIEARTASAADLIGGNAREISVAEKRNARTVVLPRYWISTEDASTWLDSTDETLWQLVFRDVARATDELAALTGALWYAYATAKGWPAGAKWATIAKSVCSVLIVACRFLVGMMTVSIGSLGRRAAQDSMARR